MPGFTTRLNLYKAGGGSSGTYGPDETVDVDKLNDNFDKIDAAIGLRKVTSTTRPASPFTDQIIYETDTDRFMLWTGVTWTLAGMGSLLDETRGAAAYTTAALGVFVALVDAGATFTLTKPTRVRVFSRFLANSGVAGSTVGRGLIHLIPGPTAVMAGSTPGTMFSQRQLPATGGGGQQTVEMEETFLLSAAQYTVFPGVASQIGAGNGVTGSSGYTAVYAVGVS